MTCGHRLLVGVVVLLLAAPAWATESLPGPFILTISEVVGDELHGTVRTWLGHDEQVRVVVRGIDAPKNTSSCAFERESAAAAVQAIKELLYDTTVIIRNLSWEKDPGGRILADVYIPGSATSVATELLQRGLARPLTATGQRESWCP